jgi:hypothetical protein
MNATKIAGWAGILVGILGVVSIPFYFVYAGPPPVWNVFARNLLTILATAILLVFFAGLRHHLSRVEPAIEWIASLIFGTAVTYVAVVLVAVSLEAGAVYARPDGTVDPTTDGVLAYANVLLHGTITRTLDVVLMAALGYAILRSGALPRALGWAAYAIAVANLAFVPSLFFGKDVTAFYSADGWGNSALTASLIIYWTFAAGVVLLRKRPLPLAGRPGGERGVHRLEAG